MRNGMAALALALVLLSATDAGGAVLSSTVRRLAEGACLRVACDLSGGMPLEHWKLRLVKHPEEPALVALRKVGEVGGGLGAYWRGTPAKLVEGSTGGAMLLAGKEGAAHLIRHSPLLTLLPTPFSGALAGACGGLAQALVMQPTTFMVTSAQTTGKSVGEILGDMAQSPRGLLGLWMNPAFVSVAARQISNWASRVGLTELARVVVGADRPGAKSVSREIAAGVLGGAMSCWNTPFEVARIHQQSQSALQHSHASASADTGSCRADGGGTRFGSGENGRVSQAVAMGAPAPAENTWATMSRVHAAGGVRALFLGVEARVWQAVWQTLFMQVFPRLLRF